MNRQHAAQLAHITQSIAEQMEGEEDGGPSSIWSDAVSANPTTPVKSASSSYLNDLDPFPIAAAAVTTPLSKDAVPSTPTSTSTRTIGSTLLEPSLSKLSIMSNHSPESPADRYEQRPVSPLKLEPHSSPANPNTPSSAASASTATTPSSFFLGNIFRSSAPAAASSVAGPSHSRRTSSSSNDTTRSNEMGAREKEFDEKWEIKKQLPSPPNAPSTTAAAAAAATAVQRNPLASIASVFRSATSSSNTPATSRPLTPSKDELDDSPLKGKEKQRAMVQTDEENDREKEDMVVAFDFNKFLEQMRSRSADPIAKYLRSFLKEFSRRPPISITDQVRVINDFLDFIAGKMRNVDPWQSILLKGDGKNDGREAGEMEFDMALEAMEKLVMNRLWHLTFTPALDLTKLPGHSSPTDDLERDQVLTQRILLFSWIQPCHLDLPLSSTLPPFVLAPSTAPEDPSMPLSIEKQSSSTDGDEGSDVGGEVVVEESEEEKARRKKERHAQGFVDFARRELNKINQYKAPRDKLICVLNSCKVIFGLIRHSAGDEGADSFIPFLIYIVLKANPEHLVSNIQYIQRFRNPDKLSGEGGYFLTSLSGAISFIETMDASSLSNITQVEFESYVEKAILQLPLDPDDSPLIDGALPPIPIPLPSLPPTSSSTSPSPLPAPPLPTKITLSTRSLPHPQDQQDQQPQQDDSSSPITLHQPQLSFTDTRNFLTRSADSMERIVSKPLGAIGRIFEQLEGFAAAEDEDRQRAQNAGRAATEPTVMVGRDHRTRSGSNNNNRMSIARSNSNAQHAMTATTTTRPGEDPRHAGLYLSEGDGALSMEQVTETIDRQYEQQQKASIETLKSMFPEIESEVIEIILLSNESKMDGTIDTLLGMS